MHGHAYVDWKCKQYDTVTRIRESICWFSSFYWNEQNNFELLTFLMKWNFFISFKRSVLQIHLWNFWGVFKKCKNTENALFYLLSTKLVSVIKLITINITLT